MNPVWPLSPQKDASYYLLHMTPHGKSRAVYIALLQQPPDCLMLVFFSVMNTLSKGWHLRLSMLEINDRSAVITFKHLLLLSMSYEYFTTIPQQYTDPLEPVYSSIYWREHGAEIQKRAQFTGSRTLFTSNANINFFLNSFEWSGFECCTYELKNFSQKMLILICKHLSCIYILSHFLAYWGTWVTKFFLNNRLRDKNMFY